MFYLRCLEDVKAFQTTGVLAVPTIPRAHKHLWLVQGNKLALTLLAVGAGRPTRMETGFLNNLNIC